METKWNKIAYVIITIFIVGLCWSCSSSDDPRQDSDPGKVEQSEFTIKVVGIPWELQNYVNEMRYVSADGTTYTFDEVPIIGSNGALLNALYFTPEKCTYFFHPDSPTGDNYYNTRNEKPYQYDSTTSILIITQPSSKKKFYVEAVTDSTLVLRDWFGVLRFLEGDENLRDDTSPVNGSYRRIIYHRVSDERLQELLNLYSLENK